MRSLFYVIILLIVTGCGCHGSRHRILDEAQSLMSSDPGKALSALNGVDVSEFKDSATIARWALLYSEALVANRLSAPTDTIVDIAVDYYGRHNLQEEFQKASLLKDMMSANHNSDALATALYLQKEKEFFLYKERSRRELYMSVGLTLLVIAAGVVIWMSQRMKLQSARNSALMAEMSGLKCRLEADRDNVGRLKTTLHGLLENRFSLIDSLCQTYYETQGTKAERKAIIDKVKSEIESVRTDSFPEMEKAVNDCRGNILVRVKEEFPDMKHDDYQLLVYIASGLSARTISLLLDESVEVVYKRKSRLKSRLKNSVASSCSEILAFF